MTTAVMKKIIPHEIKFDCKDVKLKARLFYLYVVSFQHSLIRFK